jgi:hypothetical protein
MREEDGAAEAGWRTCAIAGQPYAVVVVAVEDKSAVFPAVDVELRRAFLTCLSRAELTFSLPSGWRNRHVDMWRSEIRFGPVTCGFSMGHAACVYSLIGPPCGVPELCRPL